MGLVYASKFWAILIIQFRKLAECFVHITEYPESFPFEIFFIVLLLLLGGCCCCWVVVVFCCFVVVVFLGGNPLNYSRIYLSIYLIFSFFIGKELIISA